MLELRLNKLINEEILSSYEKKVAQINEMIMNKSGAGNDFLGWVDWPVNYDKEELARIKKDAQYVRDNFDILVVCGIGGSYLGARCALEALNGLKSDDKLEIIFMGQTFSPNYVAQVMNYLKGKNFAINVISKSGTTTETSISFRLLKELLESQVDKEKARKAIYATTDKEKGALKTLCNNEGYATYVLHFVITKATLPMFYQVISVAVIVSLPRLVHSHLLVRASMLKNSSKARETPEVKSKSSHLKIISAINML